MVKSPGNFLTNITLHTGHALSLAIIIYQMKDLFKIYTSMCNAPICISAISAKSKLEKIHSTFYYQLFWQLEPPWTGCYAITLSVYCEQVKIIVKKKHYYKLVSCWSWLFAVKNLYNFFYFFLIFFKNKNQRLKFRIFLPRGYH